MKTKAVFARTNNQKKQFASIALKNRLFVNGWSMRDNYKDIRDKGYPENYDIALLFKDNVPVACATLLLDGYDEGMIACFVRKSERRNKFGSRVVKSIERNTKFMKSKIFFSTGTIQSGDFFRTFGMKHFLEKDD